MQQSSSIVTVDVGNSRIKLGRFEPGKLSPASLPEPSETLAFRPCEQTGKFDFEPLAAWLAEQVPCGAELVIGSVNRQATQALSGFLRANEQDGLYNVRLLTGMQLEIENLAQQPDRVGIDRLAAALAANAIRREATPAITIDFGTAITVDLITPGGGFTGGAILPGVGTMAQSLAANTDALPVVEVQLTGKSPLPVGADTNSAIQAGIYWGTIGAIRELIARQRDGLATPPQVFVTGSTSADMARLVGSPDYTVRFIPHLVLSGLAIAARHCADHES